MRFQMVPGKGFNDENVVHDDPVIARKLNGFIVEHQGEECFVPRDAIVIIEISEEEQNTRIRW